MDFGPAEARRLVGAGFAGVYHALRLREGRDTAIRPEVRLATIRAAREAGLGGGTCVEPVGPEHPPEEIADVMLALREAGPCFSGAMRRIPVPGTRLAHLGMISEWRLAWLVAVTRLAMGLTVPANCTHEPNVLGAASGANLLWAEAGANPRDAADRTETSRGAGVMDCIRMLTEADYVVRKGPSRLFQAEVRRPGGSGPAEQGHGRG
jgi:biotin synthase